MSELETPEGVERVAGKLLIFRRERRSKMAKDVFEKYKDSPGVQSDLRELRKDVVRVVDGLVDGLFGQPKKKKDPNAVALGQKGGRARRNKLSPKRRKEIASNAAKARWSR